MSEEKITLNPRLKRFVTEEMKSVDKWAHLISRGLNEEAIINSGKIQLEDYDPPTTPPLYGLTDQTGSVKPPYLSKDIIPILFARAVALNFFKLVNMPMAAYEVPILQYETEAGVSTSVVDENGRISTTRVSTRNILMRAVKRAFRTIMSSEALEDANVIGMNALREVLDLDAKNIADEIDVELFDLMTFGAAAGDVWWDTSIPANWSQSWVSKDYYETMYDAIVQAASFVARNLFTADFMVLNPAQFGDITILKQFAAGTPNLSMQGRIGSILGMGVWSSLNTLPGMILLGQSNAFGVYGSYIPLQYREGPYEPSRDRQQWVVRTRSARMITQGEALGRVILFESIVQESVTMALNAQTGLWEGTVAQAPINPTDLGNTLVVRDNTVDITANVTTYDSRDVDAPDIVGPAVARLDLERGLIEFAAQPNGDVDVSYDGRQA